MQCDGLREEGNQAFKAGDYQLATALYSLSLREAEGGSRVETRKCAALCLLNRAWSLLKLFGKDSESRFNEPLLYLLQNAEEDLHELDTTHKTWLTPKQADKLHFRQKEIDRCKQEQERETKQHGGNPLHHASRRPDSTASPTEHPALRITHPTAENQSLGRGYMATHSVDVGTPLLQETALSGTLKPEERLRRCLWCWRRRVCLIPVGSPAHAFLCSRTCRRHAEQHDAVSVEDAVVALTAQPLPQAAVEYWDVHHAALTLTAVYTLRGGAAEGDTTTQHSARSHSTSGMRQRACAFWQLQSHCSSPPACTPTTSSDAREDNAHLHRLESLFPHLRRVARLPAVREAALAALRRGDLQRYHRECGGARACALASLCRREADEKTTCMAGEEEQPSTAPEECDCGADDDEADNNHGNNGHVEEDAGIMNVLCHVVCILRCNSFAIPTTNRASSDVQATGEGASGVPVACGLAFARLRGRGLVHDVHRQQRQPGRQRQQQQQQQGQGGTEAMVHASIGRALFLRASVFNHSCRPTAVQAFAGRSIRVVASQTVDSTTPEVRISYGPLACTEPVAARRRTTLAQFGFTCRCRSCQLEAEMMAWDKRKQQIARGNGDRDEEGSSEEWKTANEERDEEGRDLQQQQQEQQQQGRKMRPAASEQDGSSMQSPVNGGKMRELTVEEVEGCRVLLMRCSNCGTPYGWPTLAAATNTKSLRASIETALESEEKRCLTLIQAAHPDGRGVVGVTASCAHSASVLSCGCHVRKEMNKCLHHLMAAFREDLLSLEGRTAACSHARAFGAHLSPSSVVAASLLDKLARFHVEGAQDHAGALPLCLQSTRICSAAYGVLSIEHLHEVLKLADLFFFTVASCRSINRDLRQSVSQYLENAVPQLLMLCPTHPEIAALPDKLRGVRV